MSVCCWRGTSAYDERMSIPAPGLPVPERVRVLARGAAVTPLWQNALDIGGIAGVTFATDDGRVIKYGPRHEETSMAAEAERLSWATRYTSVPAVLEQGQTDADEWLVTAAIAGLSAVAPRWIADPARAVDAVGRGLRLFHDALPVEGCPFDWSVPSRIENAARRGVTVPRELHHPPEVDVLVVAHGDACVPNTLLDAEGAPLAHVDLGALGVADRWADIAVASMSTEWNYGPGFDDALIAAYGVAPDRDRLAYYRALWNAT